MSHHYTVANASWPDHLVFGIGDGKLDTVEAVERRFATWREQLGTEVVQWREVRTRHDLSHYYASDDNPRTQEKKIQSIDWDDFAVVPRIAHENGMKAHLYISVLDDGRALMTDEERIKSFHNAMHGQHVTWQTDWSRQHPELMTVDRSQETRQWGVPSYSHPAVRNHMVDRIESMVDGYDFDGVFLCLRSQCRPAEHADQFGFDEQVCSDMLRETGKNILEEDFDLEAWRRLLGSYFTEFLREAKSRLASRGMTLSVGTPRGDVIGPPLGNWDLQWHIWVEEGIVDQLVVNQNSSQCPSMWHQLWPMHRGYGFVQNYIDGKGMSSLADQLREIYSPVFTGSTAELYVARQWSEPNTRAEEEIRSIPGVSGLVFSTFRFDNPEAVARGNWVA